MPADRPTVGNLLRQRSGSPRMSILEGASGQGVTWADVEAQARRWVESGLVGPVGLAIADPVAMATNFVAAVAAGVLVAPLDPAAPPADLAGRVRQLGLRSLVTDSPADPASPAPADPAPADPAPADPATPAPDAPDDDSSVTGIDTWVAGRCALDRLGGETREAPPLPGEPAPVAAIMASSGTTGEPKIIPLTETQLLATAVGVAEELRLGPGERGYSPLPLFHINGLVVGVLSALVADSTIVVERQFSRRSFWSTVERTGATWLNLVPAIISILGESGGPTHGGTSRRIRLARSASAPLPDAVRSRFEAATAIPVVETYGMTEAASQITANPIDLVRPGSVGRAVGLELRVTDATGAPLSPGSTGRVRIRGHRVTSTYWSAGREGGTWSSRPAVDADGWLDTGDLGHLDPDGYLYLVGRDSDVINRGGEKIHPREVEELILTDGRVAAAAVVSRPHPVLGEEPVAYVLATEAGAGDPERLAGDLRRLCDAHLSRFKRPAEINVARSLPAGPTGKLRRSELRAMACGESPPDPAPDAVSASNIVSAPDTVSAANTA